MVSVSYTHLDRTLIAVTQWLKERLRLDVSPEKTRVVDVRRSYSEFLGFKIRLRKKGKKYVVQSHMCDKAYKKVKASLTKQVGNIKFPRKGRGEAGEVRLFNSMVMGIQNYYQLATDISIDCGDKMCIRDRWGNEPVCRAYQMRRVRQIPDHPHHPRQAPPADLRLQDLWGVRQDPLFPAPGGI